MQDAPRRNIPTPQQRTEIAALTMLHPVTVWRAYHRRAGRLATRVIAETARRLGLAEPPPREVVADEVTP